MTANTAPAIETFCDPASLLRVDGHRVKRRVRIKFAGATLDFFATDLAHEWVTQSKLIAIARLGNSAHDTELLDLFETRPRQG